MINRIDEMSTYFYEGGTTGVIEFEYEYEPGEAEVTYYSDGSGYPGSSSEVTIHHAGIQLKNKNGEFEVPLVEDFIVEIKFDEKIIIMDLPEGLIE